MSTSLADIALKVKTIQKRNPAYTEVVQWVGDLVSETLKGTGSEEFYALDLNFDQPDVLDAWSQGRSFFNPEELSLNWENIDALYRRLLELVKKRTDGERQAEGLLKAIEKKHDGTPELMKAALASDFKTIDTAAQVLEIDSPVLALLLRLSLRPALLSLSEAVLEHLNLDHWHYGHCPVCGAMPKLADFSGESGKRRLHCSLCETVWGYPRLRCPFCETDDREDLSYLKAENESGLRVDLCSHCNHYLKTIDLREIPGPIILPLDDVATWHLDIIAGESFKHKDGILSRAI